MRGKTSADNDSKSWKGLPPPYKIIELTIRLKLSIFDAMLLHVLRASMNKKNLRCWKTAKTLAREMGCSKSSVTKAIDSLKEKGILSVSKYKKKFGFDNNCYEIIYPWKISTDVSICSQERQSVPFGESNVCLSESQTFGSDEITNEYKIERKIIKKKQHQQERTKDEDDFFLTL